jgi:hypothetical protein
MNPPEVEIFPLTVPLVPASTYRLLQYLQKLFNLIALPLHELLWKA